LPKLTDAAAAARALGMTLDEHDSAACPLPEHSGVAWLVTTYSKPHDGELTLVCDCHGVDSVFPGDSWRSSFGRSLADAYMAVRSGTTLDRENTAQRGRFVWRLLLLGAAGVVEPEPIDLAALPEHAEDAVKTARDLFALLAGLRTTLAACIREAPLPMPFSEDVVRRYCRLPGGRAPRSVIDQLTGSGVIEAVGKAPRQQGQRRSAFLYEPGRP
jgi:hypothetical protein